MNADSALDNQSLITTKSGKFSPSFGFGEKANGKACHTMLKCRIIESCLARMCNMGQHSQCACKFWSTRLIGSIFRFPDARQLFLTMLTMIQNSDQINQILPDILGRQHSKGEEGRQSFEKGKKASIKKASIRKASEEQNQLLLAKMLLRGLSPLWKKGKDKRQIMKMWKHLFLSVKNVPCVILAFLYSHNLRLVICESL